MPITIARGVPTILLRKSALEQHEITRREIDELLNLTPDEFQTEQNLIAVGPLHGESVTTAIEFLESRGLVYFEDFFDLSGNWPEWLTLYARILES
jgi:hypothetical protein